jgi:hypothetical protein
MSERNKKTLKINLFINLKKSKVQINEHNNLVKRILKGFYRRWLNRKDELNVEG